MIVLGIETSCDETAVSLVLNGEKILSQVIFSQDEIHRPFGGVFPEFAARRHIDVMIPVLKSAFQKANLSFEEIDVIAATKGPGLIGSLLIGLNAAKALSIAWKKPFVGVNHIEAHLYAAMMGKTPKFPALGIVVSGGHTFMVQIDGLRSYQMLGQTVDDAIGEAFDKVAKKLGLAYPGGPLLEKLARRGDPKKFPLKAGHVKRSPLDFSFSGLKTAVLYALQKNPSADAADIAASFQEAAISDIVQKSLSAKTKFSFTEVYVGGGVSSNSFLQKALANAHETVHLPEESLRTDNAAMIAGLGYHIYKEEGPHSLMLEASPRISLV